MASDKVIDIYLDNINAALTRIRSILFVNLALCAVVLSNAYLERYSFDDHMTKNAYVYKNRFAERKQQVSDLLKVEANPEKKAELEMELSHISVRADRVDNTLKDYKLRSVLMPLTGVNIPANDVNIICGIFLLCISLWLLFSENQIRGALRDEAMLSELKTYIPALRHGVMFVIPRGQPILRAIAVFILLAPAMALTVATLNDVFSILAYDQRQVQMLILSTIIARLMLLTLITASLWAIGIVIFRSWREMTQFLYPQV